MSWLCQRTSGNLKIDQIPFILYEFRNVDPKTKQIYTQYVKDSNLVDFKKYQNWKKTKIQTLETRQIYKSLKQNAQNFVDPAFPHNNSVLTKNFYHGDIEWMRIQDIIQNATYSRQNNTQNLQKIKLNNKQFQKALMLLARTSPSSYKQLLNKRLNSEGFFQFKLFRNGYIQNVIVDDYIPTINKIPIFVGPARENEVYPMLLQKAIAKICGSYQDIPEQAEQIMQIIFNGPVHKSSISQLRDKDKVGEKLNQALQKSQLTVLLSKRDPKIRNYGLNQYQVYHVIANHRIQISKEQVENVYELVSESKISPWNGKYSLNDKIWKQIDSKTKNMLYASIKSNSSFCISQHDISRHFDELLVLENIHINNKDWIANQSENDYASFNSFIVEQKERVYLRVSAISKIRQTLILVKVMNKQYVFIEATFEPNNNNAQISCVLQPGKYILCVYHEWFLNKSGQYHLFLSSESHISLNRGGISDKEFLNKVLLNYEQSLIKDQKQNSKSYSIRILVQKLGLAYLYLRPQNTKSKSIKIQFDHNKLAQENWQMIQPYKGIPNLIIDGKNSESDRMLILMAKQVNFSKKIHFPAAAFKLKD